MSYVYAALFAVALLSQSARAEETEMGASHPYAGMWVTEDGHVRHELLPNGRYIEARGHLDVTYQGTYWIEGDHIEYRDDTGYVDSGDFVDGVLHNSGMVMYAHD